MGSFGFQGAAGDGVFVPEVLDRLDELAFGGVEVAVEFVSGEVVKFFQDEGLGFLVSELAADLGKEVVGFGEAGEDGGAVFLQGGELFFILFLLRITRGDFRVHLCEKSLVLGLEIGITEALELELEIKFIGEDFRFRLALLDALFELRDGFFLCL